MALSTCTLCRETRLGATYLWEGTERKTRQRCKGDKAGLVTEKNNAAPLQIDASGGKRYGAPCVLACLTMEEKILIDRLSAAVTIHHMAHGGVEGAGHVATSPKPVEPMAAVRPRLPSDVTIARVRRGATARAAATKNGIYTVRAAKVIDALRWLKTHNPYYSEVTIYHSRIDCITEGAEIPEVQDWDPGRPRYPRTKGLPPTRHRQGATPRRRRTRQAVCFCVKSRLISETKSERCLKHPTTRAIEGRSA